ncbi:MAG: 1-deoxy-D-xylulose-5-phosphate synthase [Proteobacteria bacterium]|nr:1-deoxy-D-xylulose-5-phosphate synthase [Pseudomonadota bacterium]
MPQLLDMINGPDDLKRLESDELLVLCQEVRDLIIGTLSKVGGHLASNLGTVELAVALHRVFDSPKDKIIWDVGHQAYPHKILTGRRDRFHTIRQHKGLSGFLRRDESPHDVFGAGHSSTSISAGLGFAKARDLLGHDNQVVAVIGDGACTAGMAFEAMNNAGHLDADMIVVLNDNEMSIAKNVGALSSYLSQIRMQPSFIHLRDEVGKLIKQIPGIGKALLSNAQYLEEHLTYLLTQGVLFEALGFTYLGPFDGHDVNTLVSTFEKVKGMKGPRMVHVVTQKGKGYAPAENDPIKLHGVVAFDIATGKSAAAQGPSIPQYTEVFGKTLVELAKANPKVVAITAAMPQGTGLVEFSNTFPQRFFDVGIAEQHAVTFAAGLAAEGIRPVAAIYSTFMQRAYDQIVHDVCIQNLPVVLAMDRAGLVGEDGGTHMGMYDIAYLRALPNMVVMAPKDENELRHMLYTAVEYKGGPIALRYPRGTGVGVALDPVMQSLPIGVAELLREGRDVALLAYGNTVYPSLLVAEQLASFGIQAAVVNMRFVKPIDAEMVARMARECTRIVTLEEHARQGGFGSAVLECLAEQNLQVPVHIIGVDDHVVEHAPPAVLREQEGVSADAILAQVRAICSADAPSFRGELQPARSR